MSLTPSTSMKISIAVRAWNEEKAIRTTLESLFQQSLFQELNRLGERCEIICIPNGCTDRTAEVAGCVFAEQRRSHPYSSAFAGRVEAVAEAGRNNTWNLFVHSFASKAAEFLFLMDSDIVFGRPDTLLNMYEALRRNPEAHISSDHQFKDIYFKKNKSLRDRISLATTDMTRTIEGQITGQLYCIRADVARRLYLPKDLGAPDDGFIKAAVCSDFFTKKLMPSRIVVAENAAHIFEAYTSIQDVLNNQKRQMIGQTTVHVLVEHLESLSLEEKSNLVHTLRTLEADNPDWLKELIGAHMRRTKFFWRLFPDALTFRFNRWRKIKGWKRITHFPAALTGFAVSMVACARAYHHLKQGLTHYWPKAGRDGFESLKLAGQGIRENG